MQLSDQELGLCGGILARGSNELAESVGFSIPWGKHRQAEVFSILAKKPKL
jgi:hypothetical protein